MATRNRVIYQSEAVYVSQSGYNGDLTATSGYEATTKGKPTVANAVARDAVSDLHRVQSANYSFSIARQDVNQFGELAAIDRIITETPTVSLDTSYILATLDNEHKLGFEVTPSGSSAENMVSCISGIINTESNAHQKDYFILTTKEGSDAIANTNTGKYESIIGIGNGFISSYSAEAAVGGLPTASVSVEAMNMNFNTVATGTQISSAAVAPTASSLRGFRFNQASAVLSGISGINPAINPTDGTSVDKNVVLPIATTNISGSASSNAGMISALRPGDITLSLIAGGGALNDDLMASGATADDLVVGADIKDAHIQSFTLSFDMSRTPIQRLGTRFAFARPVDFPITASLSVDAILADLTTGTVSDLIDCDSSYDAIIKMKDPRLCGASTTREVAVAFLARDLKVDSESFSSSIGDNKSVTLDFSCQIGGPEQTNVGVFMSGFFNQLGLAENN